MGHSMEPMDDPVTIWTIGHSTLPIDRFVTLLAEQEIAVLADVRRFAGSRRNPQYGADALSASLHGAGVEYRPFSDLGGRRTPHAASTNTAWRNASFRGYADYGETVDFRDALRRLVAAARRDPTEIMCAEALWWRCHRSIIADHLMASGHAVLHIGSDGVVHPHRYTAAAQLIDGQLSYADQGSLGL
jgi:uncharacterized protein (DUF488 family)